MNLPSMQKLSTRARIIIAAIAVLALVVVIVASAYAGAPVKEWAIPAPSGTKFEVNAPQADMIVSRNATTIRVAVETDDVKRKAKARWWYAGRNCYADGFLDQVLSEIDRCATQAVGGK